MHGPDEKLEARLWDLAYLCCKFSDDSILVVVGVKGLEVPLPREPTAVSCTLNNGVHYVTTPECALSPDCVIDQEFAL